MAGSRQLKVLAGGLLLGLLILAACGQVVGETAVSPPPITQHPQPTHEPVALDVRDSETAPRLQWQVDPGAGMNAPAQVAGGNVIVATETAVLAYHPQTGAEVWRVTPERGVWSRSLAGNGRMVAVGIPGGLLALDAVDGTQLWQTDMVGEVLWPPLVTETAVYVGTAFVGPGVEPDPDGKSWIYALDARDGAVHWSVETETYALTTPAVAENRLVVGGSFLAGDDVEEGGGLRIYAFDRTEGTTLWHVDSLDGFIKSLAVDEYVTFLAYTDMLYGLNVADGTLAWKYPTENWSPGFVADEHVVYLGSDNAFVHAVDGSTGTAVWRQPLAGVFNSPRSRPVLAGDKLYFQSNDNQIYALKKENGSLVWHTEPEPRSRVSLALGEGFLFLTGQDGVLYAYAPD
ncbi:MAG: PQQ-binding-like beta-propeller repeat protein [Anaerolineae bacterium]|nr:PQQ-binding-like beta-propeller repeat protein [Anaerolineae bacterium]